MPRTLKGAASTAQAEGFHRCWHISRTHWNIVNTDSGAARGCAGVAAGQIRSAWPGAHGEAAARLFSESRRDQGVWVSASLTVTHGRWFGC